MRIRLSSLAFIAPILLFEAGCAYNDRVDNRVSTYDIATERARDEMILTNIVRASRSEPLAFVQLGQVTGGATTGGQLGLPSVVFGPAAATSATQILQRQVVFGANAAQSGFAPNSVNMTGSTTLNVTPSETKDFYLGLLTIVSPETLASFTGQGISRELLFYLFTEKVIEEKSGVYRQYRNDPHDPTFAAFQKYVELAMQYGLSAEPQPAKAVQPKRDTIEKSGVTIVVSNGTEKEGEDKAEVEWRLCFDRRLWAVGTKFAGNTPMCGSRMKSPDPRTVTFFDRNGKKVALTVEPRSTFAIFQFLGHLVADDARITLENKYPIGEAPLDDDDLFALTNGSPGGCFLDVSYDGRSYCVPDQGATNTKRILGLLAQLLALNTSVSDIPTTPQVQVLP